MDPYWESPGVTRMTMIDDDVISVTEDVLFLGGSDVPCDVTTRIIDGAWAYAYTPLRGWEAGVAVDVPGGSTYPTASTPHFLLEALQSATTFTEVDEGDDTADSQLTHLRADDPTAVNLDQLRSGSAASGYTAVASLELWTAEDGTVRELEAVLRGDPEKEEQGGPAPSLRIVFGDPVQTAEPITAPAVGAVDEELDESMCAEPEAGS
jgi:hypothetical protein